MSQFKCVKCGYTWAPRIKNPKCCPKCKSRDWKPSERKAKVTK